MKMKGVIAFSSPPDPRKILTLSYFGISLILYAIALSSAPSDNLVTRFTKLHMRRHLIVFMIHECKIVNIDLIRVLVDNYI